MSVKNTFIVGSEKPKTKSLEVRLPVDIRSSEHGIRVITLFELC